MFGSFIDLFIILMGNSFFVIIGIRSFNGFVLVYPFTCLRYFMEIKTLNIFVLTKFTCNYYYCKALKREVSLKYSVSSELAKHNCATPSA